MEDVTPRTAALATLIERSLTRLSSAPLHTEPQELLFLGNWHDTVPRALIHDQALTATEMALWLVLKTYADPHQGTAFPKHEILMQHLNTSRLPLIEALADRKKDDLYRHRLGLLCKCYVSLSTDAQLNLGEAMNRVFSEILDIATRCTNDEKPSPTCPMDYIKPAPIEWAKTLHDAWLIWFVIAFV